MGENKAIILEPKGIESAEAFGVPELFTVKKFLKWNWWLLLITIVFALAPPIASIYFFTARWQDLLLAVIPPFISLTTGSYAITRHTIKDHYHSVLHS